MKFAKKLVYCIVLFLILTVNSSYALTFDAPFIPDDTIKITNQEFLANLDSLLNNFFVSQSLKLNTNTLYFKDNNEEDGASIPEFSDSVYMQRLQKLPSIIDMTYNDKVKAFIELYVNKKRKNVKVMLGLAEYYFPIFEEILDKQGLPHELKYLTIIESALNPRAVSRVGASGLWQFMYTTGKLYDLQVNSMVDERRDPIKASYAAARYLKDLYKIYKDWTLAIAAYNCGPGNVNKAIKRANGKTNFWEIYNYLPSETRGYVPAFIAANYMMNYYKEHNLFPKKIDFPLLTDTIMVNEDISLTTVSEMLKVPLQQLRDLNPQYKNDIIPGRSEAYSLKLPVNLVTTFIEMEDTIASKNRANMINYTDVKSAKKYVQVSPNDDVIRINYKAKSGDTFKKIAKKYNVDADALKEWNHMRNKNPKPGQKLIIYTTRKYKDKEKKEEKAAKDEETKASKKEKNKKKEDLKKKQKEDKEEADTPKKKTKKEKAEELKKKKNKEADEEDAPKKKSKKDKNESSTQSHTVKKGETLSAISRKYNVSVEDLKKLNKMKGKDNINAGQVLKIKKD